MINSTASKIILSILLLVIACTSVLVLVGCEEELFVKLDFQLTSQYQEGTSVKFGTFLLKPSDPKFSAGVLTIGKAGLVHDENADSDFVIHNPRMNIGYDVNKNYLFIGWYKEPECIRPWNFAEDRVVDDETILYAKWIEVA